jgi:hypothetical protein
LDDFGSGILVNEDGEDYFDSKTAGTKFDVCILLPWSPVRLVNELPDNIWLGISKEA